MHTCVQSIGFSSALHMQDVPSCTYAERRKATGERERERERETKTKEGQRIKQERDRERDRET